MHLPVCAEVPAPYLPAARHALRMLLLPLGLEPVWTVRADLPATSLYYGGNPPDHVLALPFDAGAPDYFASRTPIDPARARWLDWGGEKWPALFHEGEHSDLVASSFFWLSGWQEYVTPERDEHGRFPHHASLQARLGTTTRPAVDAYRELLAERMERHGIPIRRRTWGGAAWAFCPTHDIDYLRKWRPGLIYRELAHHLIQNTRRATPRVRLHRFRQFLDDWLRPGDLYRDALERMQAEVKARRGTATYFFKGTARDPHDVPYSLRSRYAKRTASALKEAGFEIGSHPGYLAADRLDYLWEEHAHLSRFAGYTPKSVRQHYLRYETPLTGRLHETVGFLIDSTLGFARQEGFRHATCMPFQLFDAEENRPLDVWEMPLACMESTLFNRRNLDPSEARAATELLLDTCRRFGGAGVFLWHNTLWDELDCPGWGRHFIDTLDEAVSGGAKISSLREAFEAWSVQ